MELLAVVPNQVFGKARLVRDQRSDRKPFRPRKQLDAPELYFMDGQPGASVWFAEAGNTVARDSCQCRCPLKR
jgi:hypothetical protein